MGFFSSSRTARSPQSYDLVATTPPTDEEDSFERDETDFHAATEARPADFELRGDPHLSDRFRSQSKSAWSRRLAAISARFASSDEKLEDVLPLSSGSPQTKSPYRRFKKLRIAHCLLFPIAGFFIMLGIIQFISIACGVVLSFFPDEFDRATERWRHFPDQDLSADISHWPTDLSRDIAPIACHSHNDYWRRVPLFSALQAGCIGVEADVWLVEDELYVGHTISSLTAERTLTTMYIDPLRKILERQNPITKFHPAVDQPAHGVFDTDPAQTLILLIDFKTDGEQTWQHVTAQLSPLRERGYLTYFNGTGIVNGPITVVGTGNTPFNLVTANSTYRDIFFDAPLNLLAEEEYRSPEADADSDSNGDGDRATPPNATAKQPASNAGQGLSGISAGDIGPDTFNWTNSLYASVSFKKSIGFPWRFHLTSEQLAQIRAQIRGAHRRGLKVRYWGLPSWPRSLRNHLWSVLVREGVDILNVDDLQSATKQDWKPRVFDW
ncbi:uncharacterized protein ACLA_075030 [Aspergillus clavatus NRRL 1]|uniref:Altered inheritance of mitochondria protein 6 n=1 Tax=Aspergillus clavatus (strain ATCC 1007 / CBS 513.65 / DSM 816 / NCTC 3887 / NRRL 1 / QM 1276 / 107) TaxID=344612 RepID=A1C7U4_ASPCL|nr:uncharacterized protein ACLA_075030 [Aspergillus clavatus NRRL 1]EAW14465.1 conserved hypothetical protein [Aspergillus clavatus NRRL 1]